MSNNKWKQRKFYPRNPKKYRGDPTQIFMRSSWETSVAIWLDTNPSVVELTSETVVIPYISPIDNKPHRYFVDFWMKVKNKDGRLITYLIEVKPYAQSVPPVMSKGKHKKTILNEQATYLVNQSKWKYAKIYAEQRGWKFIVLTEKEIYGK